MKMMTSNCKKHSFTVKIENDNVITYCVKCGEIRDVKTTTDEPVQPDESN
jgi:hypothetical protein